MEKIDNSDRFENTSKYCEAAHPFNKTKIWGLYFSTSENETDNWTLDQFESSMSGFNQIH